MQRQVIGRSDDCNVQPAYRSGNQCGIREVAAPYHEVVAVTHQVDNAVMNQPNADQLNELANAAANDAANASAPVAVNNVDENASAPVENTTNPTDAEEQNVSGM